MGAVVIMVTSMVLVLLELSLIVTVADLGAIGAGTLAAVGVDDRLCWGGTVLWVVDLSTQTVHTHTPLRRHLVGAHLEGDGGVVQWLLHHLLVIDVSAGTRG